MAFVMSSLMEDFLSKLVFNLSSDKIIDIVETDFMQDIYSIDNANTLCILNQILTQIETEGTSRVPSSAQKIHSLYEKFSNAVREEYLDCLKKNDRHKLI